MGIVVLDHLRRACPVAREDVVAQGGEISGSRSGLGSKLEIYGIPKSYLKEITTRQSHQDGQRLFEAFEWGNKLTQLPESLRDKLLVELIAELKAIADEWLKRQNLRLEIDRRQAPTSWVRDIVENAKGHSGGIVEQQLIGAKLSRRFKGIEVPNHPAHAPDKQTERVGDFSIASSVYHVTAAPSRSVIQKCAENLKANLHPILLVPRDQEDKATILAQEENIERDLVIISIENFVAMNIIELATEEHRDYFSVLQEIVGIYNERLEAVETDMSLRIEIT